MRKKDVQIGKVYVARISGRDTFVRVLKQRPDDLYRRPYPFDEWETCFGGWDAVNLRTKRQVVIKSARKLRRGRAAVAAAIVAGE